MKNTGMTRKMDELGRVVIPRELRKELDIKHKTPMEIFYDEKKEFIYLKEFDPSCTFCDEVLKIKKFKGKNICYKCINEMRINAIES